MSRLSEIHRRMHAREALDEYDLCGRELLHAEGAGDVAWLLKKLDLAMAEIPHKCCTCKYEGKRDERCARCIGDTDNWHQDEDNWEWEHGE